MTKRKPLYIPKASHLAMVRALTWDGRARLLDHWANDVRKQYRHQNDTEIMRAFSKLRATFYAEAMAAWRDVMLFALAHDNPVAEELRQAAADRFLGLDAPIKTAVMHLLDPDGVYPGQWLSETEDNFRAEIARAFGREPSPPEDNTETT